MKNIKLLSLAVLVFCFSCSGGKMKEANAVNEDAATAQLATVPNADIYSDGKTSLIKTAHYRFEVANVRQSTEYIESAIRKYPAYISSSSIELHNPMLENKMEIRIASEFFNELLKDVDSQSVFVNFRNIESEDVSKEFVDVESRLKTKREVAERYRDILQKKAGTIKELLEAEQQLGALQEEIEAAVSKLNYLRDRVRYSTVKLEFYQTISESVASTPKTGLGVRFLDAMDTGFQGLMTVVIGLIYLWPIVSVGVLCYIIYAFRIHKPRKTSNL